MAISYISSTTQEAASITTMPTHIAGDMIIIFAFRDSNATIPTLPAGWTSIGTHIAGAVASARIGYKIAASGSEVSGTWTNATDLVCHVYRGAAGPGASAKTTASSATVNYPALTLFNSGGDSWVAGFGGHQSVNGAMNIAPTGMTNRSNLAGVTADAAGHDTNGVVASWSSQNAVTTETAANYISFVLEILPDTRFVVNTNKSSVSVPAGYSGARVTLIGGGAGGGGGGIRGGAGTGKGGGAGGGGASIYKVFIPSESLGATYSMTIGTAGGGGATQGNDGTAGNNSTFVSGSTTITANGGAKGISGATTSAGGAGGTASIGSFTAVSTETGGAGSAGSTVSGTPAGDAATGGSTTHAGAGGGGGGGNISSTNPKPGAGGSSSTGAGGVQVTVNSTPGNPGNNGFPLFEGGGGGGGGTGGNGIGTRGGAGGAGATAGAGGGGGGGKEGSSGSGAGGGAGAAGYTLLEWVPFSNLFFQMWY